MSHEKSVATGFGIGAAVLALVMGTFTLKSFAQDEVSPPAAPTAVTVEVGSERVEMTLLPEDEAQGEAATIAEADELDVPTPVAADPVICNPDSDVHCAEVSDDAGTWEEVKAMATATGLRLRAFFVGED